MLVVDGSFQREAKALVFIKKMRNVAQKILSDCVNTLRNDLAI